MWIIDLFKAYKFGDTFPVLIFSQKVLSILLWLGIFVLSMLITMFSRFHFKLLFENKTTIENLEKKKQKFFSEWDLGRKKNFY